MVDTPTPSRSTAFITNSTIVYSVKGDSMPIVAVVTVLSSTLLLNPSGCFELTRLILKLAISLKPVKLGLVQEISRESVVGEPGVTWRAVAAPGGTVGREGGREGE